MDFLFANFQIAEVKLIFLSECSEIESCTNAVDVKSVSLSDLKLN